LGIVLVGGAFGGRVLGTSIAGNFIGTDATGTAPLGNTSHGLVLGDWVQNTQVGGASPGRANVIAFNGRAGILVAGGNANGNTISGNAIFGNAELGIDLSASTDADGITTNDAGDGDTGPNGLQNYPVISAATGGPAITHIEGSLNSVASTTFTI